MKVNGTFLAWLFTYTCWKGELANSFRWTLNCILWCLAEVSGCLHIAWGVLYQKIFHPSVLPSFHPSCMLAT